ncbi:MAG: hypothetical protein GTN89_05880 [Acidobacteria bacterium]|nr:hypothetical protein [Acidobacteriota bacterium]NIM62895.1 hypothetical protein [Acidobacteriota bacterium]NIO58838.1 hypothetical protein [Acidobacteriota bacterium]NIQ29895.1 hypothetical protein [Acidobacteriota bacterium]NIQ84619.1 hypothetical protein [Acidobacteriota bacterium]
MIPARRYAREIESRWTALLERPVVFGERDWALICDWHARGIPLTLIEDAFEQFGEKLRRWRRSPRNLGAVAPLVDEAWRTVLEGRIDGEQDAGRSIGPTARESWERRIGDLVGPLRDWLRDLLDRLDAGAPAQECEASLREGLLDHLPAGLRSEIESEVSAELGAFRERMSPEIWRSTRDAALFSAARRRLGLPPLSDPAPSPKGDETF